MKDRLYRAAFDSGVLRTALNFSRTHAWNPRRIRAAYAAPSARPASRMESLARAIAWLGRAQDAAGGGGVSAVYSLRRGWYPPYPETTGYIICTMYEHATCTGDASSAKRAHAMADWLVSLQRTDGAFPGGFLHRRDQPPVVFDVGQIVQGLVRTHQETGDDRYLDAARRGGDWLLTMQDADGAWRRNEYRGIPHAYEARTAWALAQLSKAVGDARFADAARRQCDWVLQRQEESNGWFHETAFRSGDPPLTHTIVYTIEGLLETGALLAEPRYMSAAALAADHMLARYARHDSWGEVLPGLIPGRLDVDWMSRDRWACLTGCAQTALVWFRLAELRDARGKYAAHASRILDALATVQGRSEFGPEIDGALGGAHPMRGAYQSFAYPNWAAKFHADALLTEARVLPDDARWAGARLDKRTSRPVPAPPPGIDRR